MTKQDIIDDLAKLPGMNKTITKKQLLEAIIDLDTFATKKAAQEVVDIIANLGVLDNTRADTVVNHTFDMIKTAVISGDYVYIPGFCNFKPAIAAAKPAKEGRNPQTGEPITISAKPAKKVVRIKPTAPFAKAIANS